MLPVAPPVFNKECIGGILAPVKSAYLDRLDTLPNQEKTYFKGGPVGKYLKPGDAIFFYVESDKTATGAILARATIRDARAGAPTWIWEQSVTRNPVFEDGSQYETWSSDKTNVVAITYTDLQRIEALQRNELRRVKSLEKMEDDRVGTFYLGANGVGPLLVLLPSRVLAFLSRKVFQTTSKPTGAIRERLTNGDLPPSFSVSGSVIIPC